MMAGSHKSRRMKIIFSRQHAWAAIFIQRYWRGYLCREKLWRSVSFLHLLICVSFDLMQLRRNTVCFKSYYGAKMLARMVR